MSLNIDVENVIGVLLADGWHRVQPGTFDIDAYEFVEQPAQATAVQLHGGGQSGICASGFEFYEADFDGHETAVCGPLTSLLAVRVTPTA